MFINTNSERNGFKAATERFVLSRLSAAWERRHKPRMSEKNHGAKGGTVLGNALCMSEKAV